jgi:ABC-type Fe3+/spermidine/putrescine transport system ATPase subunit
MGRMNFLPAKVLASDGVQLANGQTIAAHTDGHTPGATVEIGIRPEDVALAPEGEGLSLRVLRREFLGATMRVEAALVGSDAVLALDVPMRLGRTLADGFEISVFLPPERLHLFAAGSA